jgi:hypothetical protein
MSKCVLHAVSNLQPISALGPPVLWVILLSRVDTACDTDFVMYYSLFILHWFYLSSQTALTGYLFVIYRH